MQFFCEILRLDSNDDDDDVEDYGYFLWTFTDPETLPKNGTSSADISISPPGTRKSPQCVDHRVLRTVGCKVLSATGYPTTTNAVGQ